MKIKRKTCSKFVICLETGQIFQSITAAAASVNRKKSTMCRHLQGITKTCGGMHFELWDGEDYYNKEEDD